MSVFVIIAIILVLTGSIAFYLTKSGYFGNYFTSAEIKPQVDSLKDSLRECVDLTAKDALDIIGLQGGFYDEPKRAYNIESIFVPYYYYEGEFLMPSNEKVESELGKFMDQNLPKCIDSVKPNDFEVSYKVPKSKVKIGSNDVEFIIDMPIIISKEKHTTVIPLKEIPVSKISKLNDMLDISKYVTDSHREDPEMICMSCLIKMAQERNVYLEILDVIGDNSTQFILYENITDSQGYYYQFLNKYKK